jgi:hypothetical protein
MVWDKVLTLLDGVSSLKDFRPASLRGIFFVTVEAGDSARLTWGCPVNFEK